MLGLVLLMTLDLGSIVVEELQDEETDLVLGGAIDGIDELASDAGQLEVEEETVAVAQIVQQGLDIEGAVLVVRWSKPLADEVADSNEGIDIHVVSRANLLDALVAEAQRNTKTAHHLQQTTVVVNQLCQLIVTSIFVTHNN